MKNNMIILVFSTMGLSAISDFAGFNQIAASSNLAMIYKANVDFCRRIFLCFLMWKFCLE